MLLLRRLIFLCENKLDEDFLPSLTDVPLADNNKHLLLFSWLRHWHPTCDVCSNWGVFIRQTFYNTPHMLADPDYKFQHNCFW